MSDSDLKPGDLIRVIDYSVIGEELGYNYRSKSFPYGKVGLVVDVGPMMKEYNSPAKGSYKSQTSSVSTFPWGYDYGYYEYRSFYSDLVIILVEGKKLYVFREEIDKIKKDEQ